MTSVQLMDTVPCQIYGFKFNYSWASSIIQQKNMVMKTWTPRSALNQQAFASSSSNTLACRNHLVEKGSCDLWSSVINSCIRRIQPLPYIYSSSPQIQIKTQCLGSNPRVLWFYNHFTLLLLNHVSVGYSFLSRFPHPQKKLLVWFKIFHWIAMINLYILGRLRGPEMNGKCSILSISLD